VNDRTTWLLAGVTAVGLFAAGKTVVDRVLEDRGPVDTDLSEFEEQHYRAAGFTQATRDTKVMDDLVAWAAVFAAVYTTVKGVPTIVQEAGRLLD